MTQILKIATRKSPLALWQAGYVKNRLHADHPNLEIVLVETTTKGDKILDTPLAKIGGKGLFIKELERRMLDNEADIAVHSIKDMPYELPEAFCLGAVLKRENPADAFVSNHFSNLDALPLGAKIGTASARRSAQLKVLRPDFEILPLRGNVNTRLKKLDDGAFDAIILAAAGLIRLGLRARIRQILPFEKMLPAVGQGALGVEVRKNDTKILALLKPLADDKTTRCIDAERAFCAALEGGCSSPIAGFATIENGKMTMNGLVGNVRRGEILTAKISGDAKIGTSIGVRLAQKLQDAGADKILREDE